MGASRLLAVKLGFQWHKATGEPIVATPVAKPPSVPLPIADHRSAWTSHAVSPCQLRCSHLLKCLSWFLWISTKRRPTW